MVVGARRRSVKRYCCFHADERHILRAKHRNDTCKDWNVGYDERPDFDIGGILVKKKRQKR